MFEDRPRLLLVPVFHISNVLWLCVGDGCHRQSLPSGNRFHANVYGYNTVHRPAKPLAQRLPAGVPVAVRTHHSTLYRLDYRSYRLQSIHSHLLSVQSRSNLFAEFGQDSGGFKVISVQSLPRNPQIIHMVNHSRQIWRARIIGLFTKVRWTNSRVGVA